MGYRRASGLVPQRRNKANHSLFVGGGSCLQFVINTPVKSVKRGVPMLLHLRLWATRVLS